MNMGGVLKTVLPIGGALAVGFMLGVVYCAARMDRLRRQVKKLRAGKVPTSILRSVTRFLFVTTQVCALGWVSLSYVIAAYATFNLKQPFPITELSQQAITTILGMSGLKVLENIFEHNQGIVFGQSGADGETEDQDQAAG